MTFHWDLDLLRAMTSVGPGSSGNDKTEDQPCYYYITDKIGLIRNPRQGYQSPDEEKPMSSKIVNEKILTNLIISQTQ